MLYTAYEKKQYQEEIFLLKPRLANAAVGKLILILIFFHHWVAAPIRNVCFVRDITQLLEQVYTDLPG